MKKLTIVSASALLLLSMSVFADPHIDQAIEHTNAAIEHGKAGHASVVLEHARPALEHAMAGAVVAKGAAKSHMDYAMTDLEETIKHAKEGDGHAGVATRYAETALGHLKAANK
ncbi:MAG: metal-binding protein SmbP [Methyloglobulus sp.]|nr:metal-binding protein SmbP [Methyloglobulus sp.]